MSHLQANLTVLASCFSAVHDWLAPFAAAWGGGRLRVGPDGSSGWLLPDGSTLSGAAPYAGWPPVEERPVAVVVVGCLLGHGLVRLLDGLPSGSVVLVLEPRPEMLLATLSLTDYQAALAARRLQIVRPDLGSLRTALHGLDLYALFSRIHVLADLPSRHVGPEYAFWQERAQDMAAEATLEMQTLRRFQDTLVGNELHNFRRSRADGGLWDLRGAAAGQGAMLLGAGPSLEQVAPLLAADPPGLLLVTGLQTMPALSRFGLVPDLCLAVDPDPVLATVAAGLSDYAEVVPLIYSTKVAPKTVAAYPGPCRAMWTLGGVGPGLMREEPLFDTGGNVAVALFRLLRWLGVERVVLAGQDFGWSGPRSHAPGHHAGMPPDHVRRTMRRDDGVEVETTVQLLAARTVLERDIATAGVPVWNVLGRGLDLAGAVPASVAELRAEGVLEGDAGRRLALRHRVAGPAPPGAPALFQPAGAELLPSIDNVRRRLLRLGAELEVRQHELRQTLAQVELFLRGSGPYAAYLFTETTEVAWMARLQSRYEPEDLERADALLQRAAAKIAEMDATLGAR